MLNQATKRLLLFGAMTFYLLPLLHAQAVDEVPRNNAQEYISDESMFYYSDIGMNTNHQAVLLAASASTGGTLYDTIDDTVYVVGVGESVFIAQTIGELRDIVPEDTELEVNLDQMLSVQGRQANATNFLALYFGQVQFNTTSDRVIYLEGIGTSVIEDIDPSLHRSVEILNNNVFSIVTSTGSCNSDDGFHQLIIQY